MKNLFVTTFILLFTTSLKSQTIDTSNWEQNPFDTNHNIENRGGIIENFPEQPLGNKGSKPISREKGVNEIWEGIQPQKDDQKPQNTEPVRSYSLGELDKKGLLIYDQQNESKSIYAYVLIFFLFCFFAYYFRAAVKKGLIIFLSRFFYTNSKNKQNKEPGGGKALELKEKLTALKDIENLYSKGVINEAEFNRLKTQILN
jgi:hypothetical protein